MPRRTSGVGVKEGVNVLEIVGVKVDVKVVEVVAVLVKVGVNVGDGVEVSADGIVVRVKEGVGLIAPDDKSTFV